MEDDSSFFLPSQTSENHVGERALDPLAMHGCMHEETKKCIQYEQKIKRKIDMNSHRLGSFVCFVYSFVCSLGGSVEIYKKLKEIMSWRMEIQE